MPSVLDDHELDARWRAGLEAASVPGEAVRVETRVAHRVARRRRARVGAAAGALVAVGALIAGVVIATGSTDTTRVHTAARAGGSVFGTVIDGPPPGVARTADGQERARGTNVFLIDSRGLFESVTGFWSAHPRT